MNETHGMRSQLFGVEIETKGLGLAEAARVIAQALGDGVWGRVTPSPSSSGSRDSRGQLTIGAAPHAE